MLGEDVRRLMDLYPRIFMACHTRHVKDPETKALVSARQASILDHLDPETATTLSGLAAHVGVTPSTMSLTVDRLERLGYVRRARDTGDARRVGITLSDAGERLRDAQTVLDAGRVKTMLETMSLEDRDRALEGLALLAEAAQRAMGNKRLYGLREPRPPSSEAVGDSSARSE